MRKAVVAAGLFLFLPLSLLGQDAQDPYPAPKAEIFGGYSYVRLEGTDMSGWNLSVAGNVNNNLGIVAEASGHHNTEASETILGTEKNKLTFHSFLAGPRVTERKYKWISPFAHILAGFTRVNAKVTRSGNPATAGRQAFVAIYGWKAPDVDAARPAGEWQTLDAIVVGNHITATLNGQRVHDNAILPAMTGGALDNDELAPGPIMIQGDHSRVSFRKLVVTPITRAGM